MEARPAGEPGGRPLDRQLWLSAGRATSSLAAVRNRWSRFVMKLTLSGHLKISLPVSCSG